MKNFKRTTFLILFLLNTLFPFAQNNPKLKLSIEEMLKVHECPLLMSLYRPVI